jgi:alpha-beta hydrolase superfamily lysophospholipase
MTTQNLLSAEDSRPAWPAGEEEWIDRENGARLFIRSAGSTTSPGATLILTHGLGEHSNRYGHVATEFVARGWRVIAWDLRGHGRSSGARGDILAYESFVGDLRAVAERFRIEGCPLFFYGHSLGGQITLRFLQTTPMACQGAIVASPWLRLAFDPPWWKLALARLAMRFRPSFTQFTGNRWERLSRDLDHMSSFPDLDLVHHGISARMYFAVRAAGAQALADASLLRIPLFLLHGDADPVTSHHSTGEFFEQAGSEDKTLRILPGSRHETHNDLDRAQVIREVGDWIAARIEAKI